MSQMTAPRNWSDNTAHCRVWDSLASAIRFESSRNSWRFCWTPSTHVNANLELSWVVNTLLQPPSRCNSKKLTVDHFVRFFRVKVDSIRTSTASADPPSIAVRQVPSLSGFEPATVTEIVNLLKKASANVMRVGSNPDMAILKVLAPQIALTICRLCNLSMQSGVFPAQLKQARVLPLLKKPTFDPDDAISYRPISNLTYAHRTCCC